MLQPSHEEQDSAANTLGLEWPGLAHGGVLQDGMRPLPSRQRGSIPSLGAQKHCRFGCDRARLRGGKPYTKHQLPSPSLCVARRATV